MKAIARLAIMLFVVSLMPVTALAQEKDASGPGSVGFLEDGPSASAAAIDDGGSNFEFFTRFDSTDYASFGLGGLRTEGEGFIDVEGIDGEVTAAYLYWQGPTRTEDRIINSEIVINDIIRNPFFPRLITGTNIGFSSDNCWGFSNSQAYRADVTDIVVGDGPYLLTELIKGDDADINGVSLLVFYDDGDDTNNRSIVVYNGNDSNISNPYDDIGWNAVLRDVTYSQGSAEIEMHVSDGQTYLDDGVSINGTQIVGPGGVFDGDTVPSAGVSLNGLLWDIRRFDITSLLEPGPNDLLITSGTNNDCLSLVIAVIDTAANGLTLSPAVTEALAGQGWVVLAEYRDPITGQPIEDAELVFEITEGPNIGVTGQCIDFLFLPGCPTSSSGTALWYMLSDPNEFGRDRLTVFVDGGPTSFVPTPNGVRDLGEPVAFAVRDWYEAVDYVAFGDSYSSGEGAEDYTDESNRGRERGSTDPGNKCHRSNNAYATHVQTPGYSLPNQQMQGVQGSSWEFVACSGARTFNVYNEDLAGLPAQETQWDEGVVQLDQAAVTPDVSLATISIGGNDAAFGDVVKKCATNACLSDDYRPYDDIPFSEWIAAKVEAVRPRVAHTYQRMDAELPNTNASVYVLGYPSLFPDTGDEQSCFKLKPWGGEQDYLREMGVRLDTILREEAEAAGFHYVSVLDWFTNHEVCGDGGEWVRGPSLAFASPEQFHPNITGQYQYWAAMDNYIDALIRAGAERFPNGLPVTPGATINGLLSESKASAAAEAPAAEATAVLTDLGTLYVERETAPQSVCEELYLEGDELLLWGFGYEPGTTVEVTSDVDDADPVILGTVVADELGEIEFLYTLPAGLPDTVVLFEAAGTSANGNPLSLLTLIGTGEGLVPCDLSAPAVTITTPADGAVYSVGEEVLAEYSCSYDGEPIACTAPIAAGDPIPTETPGDYTFRVVALAPNGNSTAVEHAYRVAEPAEDPLAPYALAALDSIVLNQAVAVTAGDVAVANAAVGQPSILLKRNSSVSGDDSLVIGDRVSLDKGAQAVNVAANTLTNGGIISGEITDLVDLPVFEAPPAPSAGPGGEAVTVPAGQPAILPPGDYGDLVVDSGGVLTLEPGSYTFASATIGSLAEVNATGASIVIATTLDVGSNGAVNGPGSEWWVLSPDGDATLAAKLGSFTTWDGRLLALEGTVQVGRYSTFAGQIVAKVITVDRNAVISLHE